MRKTLTAIAVGALAISLAAAPSVIAKKGPKDVPGTVTVTATPTVIEASTETVTVSGNVSSSSSCRKGRIVRFSYSSGTPALTQTAVTKPNGDYSATLPKPTTTLPVPASVTLNVTVDEAVRTNKGSSKGKKKGHKKGKAKKFNCLEITGQAALTVN